MTTTPTATPKDNRDAWLKLVAHLEAQLLSTRENAKAVVKMERAFHLPSSPDYQATAWAAQRLLDALQGLPVPEVPVDHTEGQASILDVLAEDDLTGHRLDAASCRYRRGRVNRARFCTKCIEERSVAAPSTSGDEPVEHRPRRLIDHDGDLWEELEDGRWGFCPMGGEAVNRGPYKDGLGSRPWGPIHPLEGLVRHWGPVREPEGDEYDRGARDDG